jgi:hypothetical protein
MESDSGCSTEKERVFLRRDRAGDSSLNINNKIAAGVI